MTLSIFAAAEDHPERVFVYSDDGAFTYAQAAALVAGAMDWLRQVEAVETVAFTAEVSVRTLVFLLAAFELGKTVLPLHPRFTSEEQLALVSAVGARRLELPAQFDPVSPRRLAAPPSSDAALAIVATSGTSGRPRGVVLSRMAFEASATASSLVLPWQNDERWLLSLPLAHVGGLSILTRCLIARRSVVLPTRATGAAASFDAEAMLECIARQQVTRLSVVPTQLDVLARASTAPAPLRFVLVGGAPAPPRLIEHARSLGWPTLCTYGMTETCSQVTLQRPGEPYRPGGSGRPLPGIEVRIRDGRIEVRGPTLLSGFRPAAEALTAGKWYPSSDLGELRDGELFVHGRADDVIISGGENVHPSEVEQVLLLHPALEAACVFGVHQAPWGELVCCAVVCRRPLELRELGSWLRKHLATFKRPRRIALLPRLAYNATGKLDRAATRELCLDQLRPIDELDAPRT